MLPKLAERKRFCEFVMLPDVPAAAKLDDAAAPARRRGGAAAGIKEQSDLPPAAEDVPASTYARLERSVILWLMGDNILLAFACLGKKSVRTPCLLMEMLIFQISLSLCMLYFFGTLDSSAVGKRALVIWVVYMIYQAILSGIACILQGYPPPRAVMLFLWHMFFCGAFGWLMKTLRDELRALGSLEPTRIKRLFEVMTFQAALLVIGATQGIDKGDMPRVGATSTFSMSLIFAWLFSVAILEVAGLDVYAAATRLELTPIEGAALLFTGIFVLAGFASYVLSEQNDPPRKMVVVVFDTFASSMFVAYLCTARIVWVARRKRRSKVSDDDPPA